MLNNNIKRKMKQSKIVAIIFALVLISGPIYLCGGEAFKMKHETWYYLTLHFGHNNQLLLFLNQINDNEIEIAIYKDMDSLNECLEYNRLLGDINSLKLNQYESQLSTVKFTGNIELKAKREQWNETKERNKSYPLNIDYLKYHLSNARLILFNNKNFARKARTQIVGSWFDGNFEITFNKDGSYKSSNQPAQKSSLYDLPKVGTWKISGDMLILMDSNNNIGLRSQIVNISENIIDLPGFENTINYALKKNLE